MENQGANASDNNYLEIEAVIGYKGNKEANG